MSKDKEIVIRTNHLGSLAFIILIILCLGEPDLLDALINYVLTLSESAKGDQ
jgi:hypothetical protein